MQTWPLLSTFELGVSQLFPPFMYYSESVTVAELGEDFISRKRTVDISDVIVY